MRAPNGPVVDLKLPSIAALADQHECSQTQVKVKTAIAVLRELGVVEGRQGVGVFVKTTV